MQLTFVQLRSFTKKFKVLGLTDEDLRALEMHLLNRTDAGRVVSGTGGMRKMRFAPPSWSRGKSGATRVCYAWFPDVHAIYFLVIYTKHEMDDLSAADKSHFRKVLETYHRWIKTQTGVLP